MVKEEVVEFHTTGPLAPQPPTAASLSHHVTVTKNLVPSKINPIPATLLPKQPHPAVLQPHPQPQHKEKSNSIIIVKQCQTWRSAKQKLKKPRKNSSLRWIKWLDFYQTHLPLYYNKLLLLIIIIINICFLLTFYVLFLFLSKLNIFHHFLLTPVPPCLLSIITHCGKSRLFDQKINFEQ